MKGARVDGLGVMMLKCDLEVTVAAFLHVCMRSCISADNQVTELVNWSIG